MSKQVFPKEKAAFTSTKTVNTCTLEAGHAFEQKFRGNITFFFLRLVQEC